MDRRRRKRRRIAEQEDERKRMRMMMLNNSRTQSILSSLKRSCMMRNLLLVVAAMIASQMDWLLAIPRPVVPDYRFHPSFCGTARTQGLSAESLFRFDEDQLYQLVVALQMPAIMYTYARDRFYAIEGLCLVLRRLIFPIRYEDLVCLFGRQTGPLSRVFRKTLSWLYVRWRHLANFDARRVSFCFMLQISSGLLNNVRV